MSGQGNLINFKVVGETDDSEGAVIIAGVPIASGTPTDGQVLIYSQADNQWQWQDKPSVSVFQASGAANVIPVAATDIAMATDVIQEGTDIVRLSPSTFTLQPGSYRAAFFFNQATFGAAGAAQQITYQFYNQTAAAAIAPLGQVTGFDANTTVVCGVDIETIIQLSVQSDISVRVGVVAGTNPLIVTPSVSFTKLN